MSEDLKDLCENCSFTKVCEMNKRKQTLQEKLDIAVKALEYYAHQDWWNDAADDFNNVYTQGAFEDYGYKSAQEALAKIKENK